MKNQSTAQAAEGGAMRIQLWGAMILLLSALILSSCASLGALSDRSASNEVSVEILDPEVRLRQDIQGWAENYIGAPYVFGAKGPKEFDCSGFTSHVLREFEIALLGSSMSQAKQGRSVTTKEAKPGDIVYFENSNGRVNHVAIVIANSPAGLEVIHATTSRGVVRDNVTTSSYWAPRLAGVRCVVDCRVGGLVSSF
ncbi:MAG: C40 family peptidase [Saprospiraceae bacterium]